MCAHMNMYTYTMHVVDHVCARPPRPLCSSPYSCAVCPILQLLPLSNITNRFLLLTVLLSKSTHVVKRFIHDANLHTYTYVNVKVLILMLHCSHTKYNH